MVLPFTLVTLLQRPQFVKTFIRKRPFKELMERIPIHIITTRAALVGAAASDYRA